MKYLDDLFQWCEKHSLSVLLDFHGLKGSQTGNPTSGNCGGCGRDHCGRTTLDFLKYEKDNLEVIRILAHRFAGSPSFLGFEVANEVSSSVEPMKTMHFYQKAYDIIRAESEDALIIMFATFNPSTYPFPNFNNVAEDVHLYFGMGFGEPTEDQQKNLEHASKAVQSLHWNVLVGEWSLGASGQRTSDWAQEKRAQFFRQFAKMQLQAWETHTIGWFYWSYKTSYANSTWNFRDMCEGGWLPGCTSDLTYASTHWWKEKDCAYAYLHGSCIKVESSSSSTGSYVVFTLLVAAIVGAVFAIGILKPEWLSAALKAINVTAGAVKKKVAAAMDRSRSPVPTKSPTASPKASPKKERRPSKDNRAASPAPSSSPAARGRGSKEEVWKDGKRPLMTSSEIIP